MQVWAIVVPAGFVAGNPTHLAGDPSQINLDELEQVSIERGLVPVFAADRLDDLGVRHRFVCSREQPEDCDARRGRSEPHCVNPPFGLVASEVVHGSNTRPPDL